MRRPNLASLPFLAGLALLCIPPLLGGLEWPLGTPRPAGLFGSSVAGTFLTGVSLAAEGEFAVSADEGELSFVFDSGAPGSSRLPSTLGTYVVVDHDRGLATLYSQLTPGTVSTTPTTVNRGSILGRTGASGWAAGPGMGFSVFDRGAGRWVNPLLLLPEVKDKGAPLIKSAFLLKGGKRYPLGETKVLPQGTYLIGVDASDPLDSPWTPAPSAPYFLRLLVDGAKIAECTFDVAMAKEGKLGVSSDSPRPYAETYLEDGRILLSSRTFSAGRSAIQVIVKDYGGNQRQASWSINFE